MSNSTYTYLYDFMTHSWPPPGVTYHVKTSQNHGCKSTFVISLLIHSAANKQKLWFWTQHKFVLF